VRAVCVLAILVLALALVRSTGEALETGQAWGWDETMHAELPAVRMVLLAREGRPGEAFEVLHECDRYPFVYPVWLALWQGLFGISEAVARAVGLWTFLLLGGLGVARLARRVALQLDPARRGIAIDALDEYAPAYENERPGTRFFSFIVTDHAGTKEKFYRTKAANLSSTNPERSWKGWALKSEEIEVPTITLDALLESEGVEHIDFLSMDIEGGEARALMGFDIARHRPELVCIEVSAGNRAIVGWYFSERGYERVEKYARVDTINQYYRPARGNGGKDGS